MKKPVFVLSNHNTNKWKLTPTRMFTVERGQLYIIAKDEVRRVLTPSSGILASVAVGTFQHFTGITGQVKSTKAGRYKGQWLIHYNPTSGSVAFGCKKFNAAQVAKLRKWAGA